MTTERTAHPKILILTLSHGAAHRRASNALCQTLRTREPGARVEVIDALAHCTRWFRAYYNSYEIPLKLWPGLWGWIENIQHQSQSTGPGWLYWQGAQPLFRFIQAFDPDTVVATEVGLFELAHMLKRRTAARFRLVAVELMDFNQAWVQPETDLYLCSHEDLGAELAEAGAPREKILCSGQPLDPAFASLPPREPTRARLGIEPGVPLLLVLFGGTGFGKPRLLVKELLKIRQPWQAVFITGRNPRLEAEVRKLSAGLPRARVLGWVDYIQEWMVAADLMISKPGGATLMEGFACGLPLLAFDPLPGNEQRTCRWIEKWGAGRWIRKAEDLASTVERLLRNPEELDRLRQRALALARPRAAYDGADAILKLWRAGQSAS
jgi:processive 1,2-diacylglycerol beta-glucosyltransferase